MSNKNFIKLQEKDYHCVYVRKSTPRPTRPQIACRELGYLARLYHHVTIDLTVAFTAQLTANAATCTNLIAAVASSINGSFSF